MTAKWSNRAAYQDDGEKANQMKAADQYKERLITETMLEQVAGYDAEDGSTHGASETHKA